MADMNDVFRALARTHGAEDARIYKNQLKTHKELHELYEKERKLIEASREREFEEKEREDSWWKRRKIGMGHRWHRTKGSAKHWWQRTGTRVKNAPNTAYHGARRAVTGKPGINPALMAAAPELAAVQGGMQMVQELQKQVKETKKKVKKGLVLLFKIILVLAVIGIIAYYLLGTTTGSLITSEAGGLIAPITNAFRGFTAPFNQFKMILTGEYDPSQLWTSKTYEDRYATIKDIGVTISNVRPFRETFISGQQLAILGNLKVASLPDEGVEAKVSAKWSDLELIKAAFGGGQIGTWDCNGEDPGSTLVVSGTQLYIGRFLCTHNYLTIGEGKTEAHTAEVEVEYDFSMKAGKQVYVGDYEQMGTLLFEEQDPMKFFGITKDQIKSWQTESPVGLGLGLLGEEGIITANIYRDEDKYELWHYLGVTVENKGSGDIIGLNKEDLILTLPNTIEVASEDDTDMDFKAVSEKEIDGVRLITYELYKSPGIKDTKDDRLKPGEYKTYYLKFRVWDGIGRAMQPDFLKGVPVSSFFVLAELKFEYKDVRSVAIKVKSPT